MCPSAYSRRTANLQNLKLSADRRSRSQRPALAFYADDHLLLMRPVILRMAELSERLPALPFEIQGGRVHEHDGEIAQQISRRRSNNLSSIKSLMQRGASVRSA